ncbi:MAG: BC1881 family protein [Lachnoanaerobaculum saburreum]
MDLKDIKTCELVEELKKREGVEVKIAEPHKDMSVSVNGPAVVLVVVD